MALKTRFKRQVFIRRSGNQTGLVCPARWRFLSKVTRISWRAVNACQTIAFHPGEKYSLGTLSWRQYAENSSWII
jgi:hypothetical protein